MEGRVIKEDTHTGFEKHQTQIQDGEIACDLYHLDIRTGFPQASMEQLFVNLQQVLERTRELCLSYWITVLQSIYIIKHFFPYSFIFYKGHKWDKTIWRDIFIRVTKETGSAVWFRREGEGFSFHRQINRFSQTPAGHRSPPVGGQFASLSFHYWGGRGWWTWLGCSGSCPLINASRSQPGMFYDPIRERREGVPRPWHLRTHHLLAWWPILAICDCACSYSQVIKCLGGKLLQKHAQVYVLSVWDRGPQGHCPWNISSQQSTQKAGNSISSNTCEILNKPLFPPLASMGLQNASQLIAIDLLKKKIIEFINLCIFGCAGSSLLCSNFL